MPSRRPKARPKRRRSHKPAQRLLEDFVGFRCPGQSYHGRPKTRPETSISAVGGSAGEAYTEDAGAVYGGGAGEGDDEDEWDDEDDFQPRLYRYWSPGSPR